MNLRAAHVSAAVVWMLADVAFVHAEPPGAKPAPTFSGQGRRRANVKRTVTVNGKERKRFDAEEAKTSAPDGTARAGAQLLRRGQAKAAVEVLERNLAVAPNNVVIHLTLARAYARVGRCADALTHVDAWLESPAFDVNTAISASNCATHLGMSEDAVRYDRAGLLVEPDNVRLLTLLAVDLDAVGDVAGVEDAFAALVVANRDRDTSAFARASLARRRGDMDALDVELALWARQDRSSDEIVRLRAEALLDQDAPGEALVAMAGMQRRRKGPAGRQVRAEALRRVGAPVAALAELDTPRGGEPLDGPEADAVRIRAWVDLGDLDAAQATLDAQGDVRDPDLLASAWYLARARGDVAEAATLEARWRAVEPSRIRTLTQLLPEPE